MATAGAGLGSGGGGGAVERGVGGGDGTTRDFTLSFLASTLSPGSAAGFNISSERFELDFEDFPSSSGLINFEDSFESEFLCF